MLDSPPTCHKHNCLMGYKHVVCNTGGPGFDSTLQHFFSYMQANFSILKSSNFSFLTCWRDACGYIKKLVSCLVCICMASQLSRWAKMTKLYSSCNLQTGYYYHLWIVSYCVRSLQYYQCMKRGLIPPLHYPPIFSLRRIIHLCLFP